MNFFDIILLAISLSMDAFAVAICRGLSLESLKRTHMVTVGLYFGIFQGLMPTVGYFLGTQFRNIIQTLDGILPLLVLTVIGWNMIKESRESEEEGERSSHLPSMTTMLFLSIATSIDAFAVGVTFVALSVPIFPAVLLIATVTFFLSGLGVQVGHLFGLKYKSKAEMLGGVILILMGLRFFILDFFL